MAADGQTGHCRRLAAGAKGGKGTVWFPCPLLTPPNPPLRRDSLRSRGETGVRGLGSGRLSAYMQLSCPEFRLRGWQRCQCAARRCRAAAFCCEKLRFHQGCTLGAPDVPVGPSRFAAHLRCVSAKEGKGSQEGTGNHVWCPVPFCPSRWVPASPPPNGGNLPEP